MNCSICGEPIASEYHLADLDTARVWCGHTCYVRAFEKVGPRAGALLAMRVLLEYDERVRAGVAWLELPGPRWKLYKLTADWAAFQAHLLRCELDDLRHPATPPATREQLTVPLPNPYDFDEAHPEGESSDQFWRR